MGTDKAFLEFGGQTLLERALAVMAAACERVTIVGDPAKFANHGTVVADVFPGCGPLGGIHAALAHSAAELNLMVAVDMPFVSAELLAFLLAAAERSDAIVTVPRAGKGLQPLCAVYRRDFTAVAEQALLRGTGARGLRAILEEVLLDVMYDLPSRDDVGKCVVDRSVVLDRVAPTLVPLGGAPVKSTRSRRAAS